MLYADSMKVNFISSLILFVHFFMYSLYANSQNTETYSVPGTYTFTVPACVFELTVEVWGGGGGGGGAWSKSDNSGGNEACAGGGGGGGGGYTQHTFPVVPGQTYTIVVGAGGAAGVSVSTTSNSGGNGGNSSFSGYGINLIATGGQGGGGAYAHNTLHAGGGHVRLLGAGGAGGIGSGGTINHSGGNGLSGNPGSSFDFSGSGGGAAGSTGNGGNGTQNGNNAPVGGVGTGGGGNGGNGHKRHTNGSDQGNNGTSIGGGGGGALAHRTDYSGSPQTKTGGQGADGLVRISYTAINQDDNTEENITICSSELPYLWNGQSVTAGGNAAATHTTLNAAGCDSTIVLNLFLNDSPTAIETITICDTDLPFSWNGQTVNNGGVAAATHVFQSINGCDSTITLNLAVVQSGEIQEDITICENSLPYQWNGQTITTGGSAVATHTITTPSGCESTTVLNLTVQEVIETEENVTICNNELPYSWNNQIITSGGIGVATHATQDMNGCDVTVTLNLTVNPVTMITDDIAICNNSLPYVWHGQTITAAGNGVATHTEQDASGCDVVRTLNLSVESVLTETENISICEGELPYLWNGQTITAGGTGVATQTEPGPDGCDIIITLNLTVLAPEINYENHSVCSSDLPYLWNGQAITTGGTGVASHTTQGSNGCENTTILNLTVLPETAPDFSVQSPDCIPAEVEVSIANHSSSECSWYLNGVLVGSDCSGFSQTINAAGCYDIRLTIEDLHGCTSDTYRQDAFCVTESPVADFTTQTSSSVSGQVSTSNHSSNASSYQWVFPGGGTSSQYEPLISFPEGPGVYPVTLYAISETGCIDSITKYVTFEEDITFYIPNTFTPNGDEDNNAFGAVITSGIDLHNFSLMIFNRWGEKIWESRDASIFWDGTYNGKMAPDGTYTWKIEFKEKNIDKRHVYTGHLNLIR